jgi:hypothetical protein
MAAVENRIEARFWSRSGRKAERPPAEAPPAKPEGIAARKAKAADAAAGA